MARRPRQMPIEPDMMADPVDDVVREDREHTADALSEAIDQLRGFDSGDVKAILYKTERGGGKYLFVSEYYPPFDVVEIFKEMKDRFNGGDFQLRVFVGGKIKKNVNFSIAAGPSTPVQVKDNGSDMVPLMLQMMQSSADRQMQMMMQMSQQTQAMFTAMQASSNQMMGVLIPAIAGGREKTSDIVQMVAALKGNDGMGSTLEMLKTAKDLFAGNGGDGGGLDLDGSIIENGLKLAGPVMAGLARAAEARGQAQPPPQAVHVIPQGPPDTAGPVRLAAPVAPSGRFPILDIVRDDVMLAFAKRRDPERTAGIVADLLDDAGVTDDQIDEFAAAFALSADPLSDLAAEGVDLRSGPEWASAFLAALLAEWRGETGDDGDEMDNTGGGGGGGDDPQDDAGIIPVGVATI